MDMSSGFTLALLVQERHKEMQTFRCAHCHGLFTQESGRHETTQDVRIDWQTITIVSEVFCDGCWLPPPDDWF
jgi:hypothetical protein